MNIIYEIIIVSINFIAVGFVLYWYIKKLRKETMS